ncbi:MAG: ankyrin repeat domain-containing protein [Planctomycetaceae bacterium]|nr:ankyrin repeat domain-containing protein [Planctomycetaceae bacterium]
MASIMAKRAAPLVQELRSIDESSWMPGGRGQIIYKDCTLQVLQTKGIQALIAARLEQWWAQSPRSCQLAVEAVWFMVPEKEDQVLRRQAAKAATSQPADVAMVLDTQPAREALRALQTAQESRKVGSRQRVFWKDRWGNLDNTLGVRATTSADGKSISATLNIQLPLDKEKGLLQPGDFCERAEAPDLRVSLQSGQSIYWIVPVTTYRLEAPKTQPASTGAVAYLRPLPQIAAPKHYLHVLVHLEALPAAKEHVGMGGIAPYTMDREEKEFLAQALKDPKPDKGDPLDRSSLHTAAERGYVGVVKALADRGANIDAAQPSMTLNWGGYTPLFLAAQKGHLEVAKFLVRRGADVEGYRLTPLSGAAECGNLELARYLIRHGARVDSEHCSAVRPAAEQGHEEMVKLLVEAGAARLDGALTAARANPILFQYLLDHGANIRQSDCLAVELSQEKYDQDVVFFLLSGGARLTESQAGKVLTALADAGNRDMIQTLLKNGARLDARRWTDRPLLMCGTLSAARLLVELGSDIHCPDENGWTPLHHAVMRPTTELAEFFISKGARVNDMDEKGQTPLFYVHRREMAMLLISKGAKVNHRDHEGQSALHVLAQNVARKEDLPRAELAVELIKAGAEVNALDNDGWTPLCFAAFYGSSPISKALLAKGADVRLAPKGGDYCGLLGLAAHGDAPGLIELLLEKGADPSRIDKNGKTLLFHVHTAGEAKLLLDRRVDINARDKTGATALHEARLPVMEVLLAAGADPNARDNQKCTPMHTAAASLYDQQRVLTLHKHGGKFDVREESGKTPLHLAAAVIDTDIFRADRKPGPVAQLLSVGADVNARDSLGRTPLHYASAQAVAPLLAAKADINARDNNGQTPLHTALDRYDTIQTLMDAGADWKLKDNQGKTVLDLATAAAQDGKGLANLPDLIRLWSTGKVTPLQQR